MEQYNKPPLTYREQVDLLQTANPTSPFKQRLIDLLEEYRDVVSLNAMGFPKNWKGEKIWNA